MPMAAAPMRTVRAKRRETAAPSSSLAACFWARQTSWEGLREGSWRCEDTLVGVERAWWWRKHAVEAILSVTICPHSTHSANLGVVYFSFLCLEYEKGEVEGCVLVDM